MRGVSSESNSVVIAPGHTAPDFELPALISGVKKRFHLQEQLEHGAVVLAFYPLNWQPISAQQMIAYQAERERFAGHALVVGISVDSIMNTTVWEREIGPLDFPLCSDFWPHGEVTRAYGVFQEGGPGKGASERAVFVVDRRGSVAFRKVYQAGQLPSLSETLEVVRKL